jgi:5,10-methylene-tetrahydrofolate dehydrogenase/methenyl tetrahydrofolate cyclohydrolase
MNTKLGLVAPLATVAAAAADSTAAACITSRTIKPLSSRLPRALHQQDEAIIWQKELAVLRFLKKGGTWKVDHSRLHVCMPEHFRTAANMALRETAAQSLKAGNTAVVTGGASGIGAAIVNILLEKGLRVVIADLAGDKLDAAIRGHDAKSVRRNIRSINRS